MQNNIQIREINNKTDWQAGLELFEYTTMFLAWEWGEFEKMRGNSFEFLGVFNQNKVIGLIPLKFINAKRGKYLHIRHGPLINWEDTETVQAVITFLKEKAAKYGARFIRISPLIDKSNLAKFKNLGFLNATSHANDDELTVIIDLNLDLENILSNMRKNTRNLVRRAEKEGVKVKITKDLTLFEDFKKVYIDTVSRKQWTAYSTDYIRREFEIFSKVGNARLAVAYYENQPISASIFIIHRNQVIYHYSGSSKKFKNIPATYLVHWEAIKYFKELGLSIYNFWGVCKENQKNHPWYGLSLFKRGFSNNELEFMHAQDLVLHPFGHLTRLYDWLEAKWRGYR